MGNENQNAKQLGAVSELSSPDWLGLLRDKMEEMQLNKRAYQNLYGLSDDELADTMKDSDMDYPDAVARYRGACYGKMVTFENAAHWIERQFFHPNAVR